MSVEDINIIDAASINSNGDMVLSISDHLEWGENNEHLLLLQNKINSYLSVIESEGFYNKYPEAKEKHFIINIVAKYKPNETGNFFIQRVKSIIEEKGYGFSFSVPEIPAT